jgi:hypothetical protein
MTPSAMTILKQVPETQDFHKAAFGSPPIERIFSK